MVLFYSTDIVNIIYYYLLITSYINVIKYDHMNAHTYECTTCTYFIKDLLVFTLNKFYPSSYLSAYT